MVSEGASCKYVNGKSSVHNTTACCRATVCVLLWMLQNTPHEFYVYIGCAPKLYLDVRTFALYGADILQNKMRVIASFIGRLTLSSMIR